MEVKKHTTRKDAIRAYCIWCCGDSKPEVRKCVSQKCPLWRFRMGVEDVLAPGERMTRGKAIKARCLDCSSGIHKEIKHCAFVDCPLHKFRS